MPITRARAKKTIRNIEIREMPDSSSSSSTSVTTGVTAGVGSGCG